MAACELGWDTISAVVLDVDPESPEALRIMLADNRTADLGTYDDPLLLDLARTVEESLGLDGSGFTPDDLDELEDLINWRDGEDLDPDWEKYTNAVNVPQYEPTRPEPPAVSEMMDTSKTDRLVQAIAAADLPDEVARFLNHAAQRHTVFDYREVAEFYAHATPDVQQLMEESALVIVDVRDAIRNGYAKLGDWLAEQEQKGADGDE